MPDYASQGKGQETERQKERVLQNGHNGLLFTVSLPHISIWGFEIVKNYTRCGRFFAYTLAPPKLLGFCVAWAKAGSQLNFLGSFSSSGGTAKPSDKLEGSELSSFGLSASR